MVMLVHKLILLLQILLLPGYHLALLMFKGDLFGV